MSYRSFFTATLAACAFLSGGSTALAVAYISVTNDFETAYSLLTPSGQLLNDGGTILGAFNNNSWSYDMENSQWMLGEKSYKQDQLTYSQLVDMQNSFTSTLGPITSQQDGTVTNGSFTLTGACKQSISSLSSPIYLMVTGKTGELAVFVFKDAENNSLLTYNDLDITSPGTLDLLIAAKNQGENKYYMDCILGNVDRNLSTIQLLVPEPATATLGLLGLAALMTRRRRR